MKNIKKRGVWMMVFGFIIILLTLSALGREQGDKSLLIITDLLGWALFTAGAFIRGKQKKEQKKLEKAMYQWANERMAPPARGKATKHDPVVERMNRLEFENAQLRRQNADLQGRYAQPTAPSGRVTPPVVQQGRALPRYHFRVAGITYRMGALRAIARRCPEYHMTDTDLVHSYDGIEGQRFYEYLKDLPQSVTLVPEPQNPHDHNAIAVYIAGHHVGYVPADETASVAPLLRGPYHAAAELSGGQWKSVADDLVSRGETPINIYVDIY